MTVESKKLINDEKQIKIVRDTLSKKFDAKQIIVFGSYAYGKPNIDSDLDLCVIIDLKKKRKIEVIRAIRRELLELISKPLDILVYNEQEFEERAGLKNTFEYKILAEGRKIYG